MPMYSPFLKALSGKMLEGGHVLEPFGASWWAIGQEESARDVDSPPLLCADLARRAPYFFRGAPTLRN